jgi:hypothetical protein
MLQIAAKRKWGPPVGNCGRLFILTSGLGRAVVLQSRLELLKHHDVESHGAGFTYLP